MSQFYAAIMTNKGAALLAEAIAGNANIQFTMMVSGDGEYTEAERAVSILQTRTSLKSQKQSVGFSSIVVESETSVHLTGAFDNDELDEGYYVREVGIFAKNSLDDKSEPVLYSIAVAQFADYMPPYNGLTPTTIIQEYFTTVNNSAEVTLVTGTGAYALAEDLDKEIERLRKELDEAQKYTDAAYQQSTGYTDRAIADLIGGAPEIRNTLKELSDAIDENADIVEVLNSAIGKKADQAVMESLLGQKLDTTGDAKGNIVSFTSSDTKASSKWIDFDLFKSGENFKAILEKISRC